VNVGVVNCATESSWCAREGVTEFPAVRLYHSSTFQEIDIMTPGRIIASHEVLLERVFAILTKVWTLCVVF
jgi:hypothetical protein